MKLARLYRLTFGDGSIYIGCTTDLLRRRVALHRHYAHNSASRVYGLPVYQAWRAFGEPVVDVLCEGEREYVLDMERRAVETFDCLYPKGLNSVAGGGRNGWSGRTHSEATKQHLARIRTGRKTGPRSAETKAKISASKKGKPRIIPPEVRAVMVANSLATKARKRKE